MCQSLRGASICGGQPRGWPVHPASLWVRVWRQGFQLRSAARCSAAVPTGLPAALLWAALGRRVWIPSALPMDNSSQLSFVLQQAAEECPVIVLLFRKRRWWTGCGARRDSSLVILSNSPLRWMKWTYGMPAFLVLSGMIFRNAAAFKLLLVTMLRGTNPVGRVSAELLELHLIDSLFTISLFCASASSLLVGGNKLLQFIKWARSSSRAVLLAMEMFWTGIPPATQGQRMVTSARWTVLIQAADSCSSYPLRNKDILKEFTFLYLVWFSSSL